MAIGNAVQNGRFVMVYDEKGLQLCVILVGHGRGDGLMGYTSTTVSIRRSGFIDKYTEKGMQISSTFAR